MQIREFVESEIITFFYINVNSTIICTALSRFIPGFILSNVKNAKSPLIKYSYQILLHKKCRKLTNVAIHVAFFNQLVQSTFDPHVDSFFLRKRNLIFSKKNLNHTQHTSIRVNIKTIKAKYQNKKRHSAKYLLQTPHTLTE